MEKKKIIVDGKETNYSVSDTGIVWNDIKGCEMKGTTARNEYRSVQLTIEGKRKSFMVHRLVAEAFVENPHPETLTIVNMKNKDPYDCRAENLEWVESARASRRERIKQANNEKAGCEFDAKNYEWVEIAQEPGYKVCKEGLCLSPSGKIIQGTSRNGYRRLRTTSSKCYSIHRLVWEAFNGPIPHGMVIDHIDGNRENNNLNNLRLVSQSENMSNTYNHNHGSATPVIQIDAETGEIIAEYPTQAEAARAIGVKPSEIFYAVTADNIILRNCYWKKKKDKLC